jgi:tetratricopeptide (TPR) repeat protein
MRKIRFLFLLAAAPAVWGGETALPAVAPAETPSALRAQARVLWPSRKTSAEPWLLLGKSYEAEGKRGKALGAFEKAVKVDPLCAEAYFRRGRLFEQKGKLDEAANEYQAALKADKTHAGAAAAWKALSERLDAKSVK